MQEHEQEYAQEYVRARLTHAQGRELWLAMYEEVKRERLLAPATGRIALRLAALSLLLALALPLAWFADSALVLAAAYAALALLLGQFAFTGHDAGHGAISGRPRVDRALGQLSMTLATGLAFDEWISRHLAHHRHCQDEERDPDMAVAFVVSLTEHSRAAKGPLGRFLTRYQGMHVWALSLLFGHSQRHLSQGAVLASPRRWPFDAAMLAAHFALWFGLPCGLLGVSFSAALLAYLVPLTLLGPHLAAIFWVNHVGMPLVRRAEDFSFFEHQAVTSRTIVNPPRWNWLFGGLNFQVEHHLFPQVPSARLPALQAIVRRHFERRALPYNGVSWWGAVRAVAAHFRRIASAGAP